MDFDVVIIGAGAAGLIAAREFARAGSTVALLEARDRVGGRLYSVAHPRALAPIELGGEFVHGRPAITYALLREFGAPVVDNAEQSFVVRDGAFQASDDDPFAAVSRLLASALERDTDESVDALIARHAQADAQRITGEWTRRLVSGFDAADPALASARAVAREWSGDASADGEQSRPVGGYAPLVAHLARALDPARVDLRLRTVVCRVECDAHGVRISAATGGRDQIIAARHALVTVPHGVLTAPDGADGAIAFDPPLPAPTRDAIAHIAMGPVVKVVLCFRTAFWEQLRGGRWRDGAFFSGAHAFPTLWTQLPVRANTLVAWAGGPAAQRLMDDGGDVAGLALACAGRYFADAAAAEAAFEVAYVHDWQRDPFARGAYSYVTVGGEDAREALTAPVGGNLWFAGETTAGNGEGGTVAGALQSGVRAAQAILASR
jgi:monoamine oxidase